VATKWSSALEGGGAGGGGGGTGGMDFVVAGCEIDYMIGGAKTAVSVFRERQ